MHWIKEAAEAKILGQAELLKGEQIRTSKLTRGTTPTILQEARQRHKA